VAQPSPDKPGRHDEGTPAMIQVHHLNNSRSQRVLWLLEELELPYEIVRYQRDAVTRLAPPELLKVHPLGKSPVITDGAVTLAESGAILEYICRVHGNGRLHPSNPHSQAALDYLEFMHSAEGSVMLPLMLALYVGRLGDAGAPLHPRIFGEIAGQLGYLSGKLGDRPFLTGDEFTAADIQMVFVLEAAAVRGGLESYPNLSAYLKRMQARPAYQRAIEKGGPYQLGA
jgi:glutathione S-transferase